MKVFVATKEGQGKRKNDFCWAKEGELVKFCFECDGESIDGNCGCRRSMGGFNTLSATTTFKVVDMDITREEFIRRFAESEEKAGWIWTDEEISRFGNEMLETAKEFPTGKVLEKRGNLIQTRNVKW